MCDSLQQRPGPPEGLNFSTRRRVHVPVSCVTSDILDVARGGEDCQRYVWCGRASCRYSHDGSQLRADCWWVEDGKICRLGICAQLVERLEKAKKYAVSGVQPKHTPPPQPTCTVYCMQELPICVCTRHAACIHRPTQFTCLHPGSRKYSKILLNPAAPSAHIAQGMIDPVRTRIANS